MAKSKFIAIYDGKANTNPSMTAEELFKNQKQWDSIEDVWPRRSGTGRVIAVLELVYTTSGELGMVELHRRTTS